MNSRHLVVLLCLAFLVVPALRAEPETTEVPTVKAVDIMEVSPVDFGRVDTRALIGKALAAYSQKRYEDAARIYIDLLRKSPGDNGALYNLACCYGLLGAPEQAAAFVEAAYRAGFHQLGHIKGDKDFRLWLPILPVIAVCIGLGAQVVVGSTTAPAASPTSPASASSGTRRAGRRPSTTTAAS